MHTLIIIEGHLPFSSQATHTLSVQHLLAGAWSKLTEVTESDWGLVPDPGFHRL